jgi:hypothetical protein
MTFDIPDAAVTWLSVGERGTSSEAIFERMTGLPMANVRLRGAAPRDPADLRRCRLLLEAVPEWRARLGEMTSADGWGWDVLVPAWDDLCATMDADAPDWREGSGNAPLTYRKMTALLYPERTSR